MQRLSSHVYFIEGNREGRYPFCNCLYIKDKFNVLIDTGAGEFVRDLRVDFVLNSHWHEDHIACNAYFDRILVHEGDAGAVRSYEEFKNRYALPDDVLRHFTYFKFSKVDEVFKDGDVFETGNVTVTAIHTPGHSEGHCCFLVEDNVNVLYLADIDLTSFGPWYGCLDSNLEDFIKSIEKIKKIIEHEDVEIAFSGHKGVIKKKNEILVRLNEYLARIFDRDRKLLDLLEDERSIDEIIGKGVIYKRFIEPKEAFVHFERLMIKQHLDRLLKMEKVRKVNNNFIKV